jgi:ribonuclease P protein component
VKRNFRLTRSIDFKRVRNAGKSYAHPLVVLVASAAHENDQEALSTRVGVTAGRSVGGAVERNRAKRLLREAMRSLLPGIRPGWDLVLIARQALSGATYQQVCDALTQLLQRAGLFAQQP